MSPKIGNTNTIIIFISEDRAKVQFTDFKNIFINAYYNLNIPEIFKVSKIVVWLE